MTAFSRSLRRATLNARLAVTVWNVVLALLGLMKRGLIESPKDAGRGRRCLPELSHELTLGGIKSPVGAAVIPT